MIEMVWEFVAKKEARVQFELTYGPGGAWGTLFACCPGFRGITLLRDTKNPHRYLAIELWDTEDQRQQALSERQAEHANLDAALAQWTESTAELGVFQVRVEATVRPLGRAGRAGSGETGRRVKPTARYRSWG